MKIQYAHLAIFAGSDDFYHTASTSAILICSISMYIVDVAIYVLENGPVLGVPSLEGAFLLPSPDLPHYDVLRSIWVVHYVTERHHIPAQGRGGEGEKGEKGEEEERGESE